MSDGAILAKHFLRIDYYFQQLGFHNSVIFLNLNS